MVKTATIKTEEREETGTNQSRRLRKEGFLPGVIYGKGEGSVSVKFARKEFLNALSDEARLYELDVEGTEQMTKLKDIQWDPLGENILHVDMERISMDEPIELDVPIETTGSSTVLSGTGAYMEQHQTTLKVSCLPENIPEEIPIPIEDLQIGDTVHVRDVVFPEGVEPAMADDRLILSVHEAREILVEEEEEEMAPTALEPELIGEEEEEEEELLEEEGPAEEPEPAEEDEEE